MHGKNLLFVLLPAIDENATHYNSHSNRSTQQL